MSDELTAQEWDARFLTLAHHVGQWSKDRSAKTGSVIVDADGIVRATGYNGFARGVNDADESKHERPAKYLWSEHAERNAIYNEARVGVSVKGCTVYVNWFPCADCARAIVQTGIARLVGLRPDSSDQTWGADFQFAQSLFREVGLEVVLYDYSHLGARAVR